MQWNTAVLTLPAAAQARAAQAVILALIGTSAMRALSSICSAALDWPVQVYIMNSVVLCSKHMRACYQDNVHKSLIDHAYNNA